MDLWLCYFHVTIYLTGKSLLSVSKTNFVFPPCTIFAKKLNKVIILTKK